MTDDMKQLCAAIGHALLVLAGEDAQPKPEKPKRQGQRPIKELTCIVCGAAFKTQSPRAMLCPHCRILRTNGNRQFLEAFSAAKRRQDTQEQPQDTPPLVSFLLDPPPPDKIRCERMHATIPATMCGTRGECKGKPTCKNLPSRLQS